MDPKYVYPAHTVRWRVPGAKVRADGKIVRTDRCGEKIRKFKTTEVDAATEFVKELDARGINYRYYRWVECEATPHETKMHFRKWSVPPGMWEVVREYDEATVDAVELVDPLLQGLDEARPKR